MSNGVAARRAKKSARQVVFSNPGSVRSVRRAKFTTRRVGFTTPGVKISTPGVEYPTRRLVEPHQGAEKKEEAAD